MKKIFKLLPVSVFDFPGLELWLGQMANEGLFPVKIRSPLAIFTRTGTPGTRFRVEPCGTEVYDGVGPDQDKRDLYRSFGWELAFVFHNDGNVLALFYTATPSAPELYTDLSAQAATLEPMLDHFRRRLRQMLYLAPLLILLFPHSRLGSRIRIFSSRFLDIHDIYEKATLPFFIAAIVLFYIGISELLRDYTALSQVQKQMAQGVQPTPRGPSRRYLLFSLFNLLVCLVFLLLLILSGLSLIFSL